MKEHQNLHNPGIFADLGSALRVCRVWRSALASRVLYRGHIARLAPPAPPPAALAAPAPAWPGLHPPALCSASGGQNSLACVKRLHIRSAAWRLTPSLAGLAELLPALTCLDLAPGMQELGSSTGFCSFPLNGIAIGRADEDLSLAEVGGCYAIEGRRQQPKQPGGRGALPGPLNRNGTIPGTAAVSASSERGGPHRRTRQDGGMGRRDVRPAPAATAAGATVPLAGLGSGGSGLGLGPAMLEAPQPS
ncbi:hypothetical protein VOLCADRAFT_95998 [Volvox carteri f. nagariensis]|uniref:F-box domain-containing protein n=1 Tax=Volvox carteri f. nagariensis TaxID=3068 RepID=D8U8X9_VOLCA|nr:uncharacterized protein VOLCADRAFT_95998 [Volvox carteri f. nagariensis]EFJ43825.1 hypothetical protein VOLCADRAFT_95998 [Volvox carteri f. nagariensis]|eukprot:XP_002955071.1 hypothetical protein VOLCADRAFT_95998 [Volvox carteri f. nagariensis]